MPNLLKAVKITMVTEGETLVDKFKIAADAGFDGISLRGIQAQTLEEAQAAMETTGLPIHNVNLGMHWKERLSSPEAPIRDRAEKELHDTIQFADAVGASSILLIVGKVTDEKTENHDQVWERSSEIIQRTIPLAARHGVRILCENVWNGFCQDADQWKKYLDSFQSPWVGAFLDIGNHEKVGGGAHWLETLDNHVAKIDVKDYSAQTGKLCQLFEGDVDWKAVQLALEKIRYQGWATAEVKGGGLDRLKEVAQRMDRALGITG